jgi:hypothetical protein
VGAALRIIAIERGRVLRWHAVADKKSYSERRYRHLWHLLLARTKSTSACEGGIPQQADLQTIPQASLALNASAKAMPAAHRHGRHHHAWYGLLIWVFITIFAATSAVAGESPKPLSENQLLGLLKGDVYSSRVAILVRKRGIAFVPTKESLEALRRAGGNEELIHVVATAKPIIQQSHALDSTTIGPAVNKPIVELPALKAPNISRHPSAKSVTAEQETIAAGTKITMQNWRDYQQYMPLGMVELFKGELFWKMPADIEIDVGPTIIEPLPSGYVEATEEHSHNVRIVHLSNGHNDIINYVGGEPFPNPQEPNKGYKLLADLWFGYVPQLAVGTPQNTATMCSHDRFGDISCSRLSYVYRQTAYNTDPNVQRDDPNAEDSWFTEWGMVEEPEEVKYTTQLTLWSKDNQHYPDVYTFIPALRISLRGSLSARCSPVVGTDYNQDDYRSVGFNGGIGFFGAEFVEHRKIIALKGGYAPMGGSFPQNYYMPLGWPKPSWGMWQLRDVDVIDVRRVREMREGYCYGKRIIYEDSHDHYALWEEMYDADMRLWRMILWAQRLVKSTSLGYVPGSATSSIWDLRNDHMTNVSTEDEHGHDTLFDLDVPVEYRDYSQYATPGGLMKILK